MRKVYCRGGSLTLPSILRSEMELPKAVKYYPKTVPVFGGRVADPPLHIDLTYSAIAAMNASGLFFSHAWISLTATGSVTEASPHFSAVTESIHASPPRT